MLSRSRWLLVAAALALAACGTGGGGGVLSVAFTSPTLSPGVPLSGVVNLGVSASGATQVEFWIDGVLKHTDSSAPFSFSWDTTTSPNGPVSVVARASGGGGTGQATITPQVLNKYLVVRDDSSWGANPDEAILTANQIPFDVIASSALATTDLSPYRMVVLPGDQPSSYYTNVNASLTALTNYVSAGHVLLYVMAAAENEPAGWTAPGGAVRSALDLATSNVVLATGHLLVRGVSSPFSGNYASHGHFTTVPAGAVLVTGVADATKPTLITYQGGTGRVIALSWPQVGS